MELILRFMENQVLHIRHFREHGDDVRCMKKQKICELCGVFEKAILDVMYVWEPGSEVQSTSTLAVTLNTPRNVGGLSGSFDDVDALANFIVRVRDVHGDFGERDVAYALLWTWSRFFPEWALRIFHRFVGGVGCWSDVKYMCGFLRDCSPDVKGFPQQSLIVEENLLTSKATVFRDAILDIMLQKILEEHVVWGQTMDAYLENRRQFFGIGETYGDVDEYNVVCGNASVGVFGKRMREPLMKRPCARKHLSLAAKWCPRETSKYGWVFALLVERYQMKQNSQCSRKKRRSNNEIPVPVLQNGVNENKKLQESSRHLRQMVSRLSRELHYVE